MVTRPATARATFQEQVVDQLGAEICAGQWQPGQILPSEPELCTRFGYSRIVIREAIKSLVSKGMLKVGRRFGTLVLEPACWNLFDPQVIAWRAAHAALDGTMSRDLLELRRVVEPAAVRMAALRASEAERRALRAAYMAMARAVVGKGNYIEADLAFHGTILLACGNQYLRQMQEAMSAMLEANFEIVTQKVGGTAASLPLHEAVCVAIEQADPVAAERAALALIEQSERDLRELIDAGAVRQRGAARAPGRPPRGEPQAG